MGRERPFCSGDDRTSSLRARAPLAVLLIVALVAIARHSVSAQEILITEFIAINGETLLDEDGQSSDWFELQNTSGAALDLDGWFVTDTQLNLFRWRFPAVTLGAGDFLVVFASGKNRVDPSSELHTNFQLDGDGEYLAIVRPDGSVAHEYAPEFPPQRSGFSYGIAQTAEETLLVWPTSDARVRVPVDASEDSDWNDLDFDDSDWIDGRASVGYDTEQAVGNPGDAVNVAPEGTATQSSQLGGFAPGLAIDGDLGNFTHTQAGVNVPATWELDLARLVTIGSVVLHNRTSCCGSRLRDITVTIFDEPGGEIVWQSDLLNAENELGGATTSGPDRIVVDVLADVGAPVRGRVVRVVRTPDPDLSGSGGNGNDDEADVLSLAEVEVFELPAVGYHGLIATDVESEMSGVTASAYIRVPFFVEGAPSFDLLKLRMKYDDGFIARINGRVVATRNAPASPDFDSSATASHSDTQAVLFEDFVITEEQDALREGENVLTIHGLNSSTGSSDFLIVPELVGLTVTGDAPRFFRQATPGAPNDTDAFSGFVADTKFSVDRGFYTEPFEVEIETATPGAQIRYTTNGDPPTASSGFIYSGSITISRTTTLRAAAFRSGYEPTNVDTHTYLFLEDVVLQDYDATLAAGFPATWGSTSPDYGMDPDVIGGTGPDRYDGKYAATVIDDLQAIPTLSVVMRTDEMFGSRGIYTNSGSRGSAWERACSFEIIQPDGRAGTQVNCGIRIQGGAFRSHGLTKKHSLRFLFKSDYGPTKLRYPIFGDEVPARFDTITFRANSNDGWQWSAAGSQPLYIRDSFGRESVLAMGSQSSSEAFVHLYINGIYWGVYNPVERPDASFSATYWGGDKENWDALSNGQASNGNWDSWNAMISLLEQGAQNHDVYMRALGKNPDGSDNPSFPQYVDVTNLADYMISNLYGGNSDWPHKNYWMTFNPADPSGFKYHMWDSEWSLDLRSNVTTNRTTVNNGIAEAYGHLRFNEEFQVAFGDRLHKHFFNGGAFYVDPANSSWDPARPERNVPAARFFRLGNEVKRALVAESARWGDQHASTPYTVDEHWQREFDDLLDNYFPRRSANVISQFRAVDLYPDTEAPSFNQHGGFIEPGFELGIRATIGRIYYTLNGEDPRLVGGAISPDAIEGGESAGATLLRPEADARALVPTSGELGLSWTDPDFDDSTWRSGTTGVGYENGSGYQDLIGLDVGDEASGVHPTVYIRIEFDVEDPAFDSLILRMRYDDGFVAYLNGERVASANAPADPQWNSAATSSNSDSAAVTPEIFDITANVTALRAGRNVLAIHGLNTSAGSSDFLLLPELSGSAVTGDGVILRAPTLVKARTLDGDEWSALNEAQFVIDTPLRITELMYHPAAPEEGSSFDEGNFEFVELQNISGSVIDLEGVSVEGGISFDFTGSFVTVLQPGEVVVLVEDLEAFATRYNVANILIAGEYSGRLENMGENLRLVGPFGENILDFEYDDAWHPATDGSGPSLVIVDPFAEDRDSWRLGDSWRVSDFPFGSPGVDESEGGIGGRQLPGDSNADGSQDVSDVIRVLRHLFLGGGINLPCGDGSAEDPANLMLLDFNGDGTLNLTDSVAQLSYLFQQGPAHIQGTRCLRIEGCPEDCGF